LLIQGIGTILTLAVVLVVNESVPAAEAVGWAGLGGIGGLVGLSALYLGLSRGTMGLVAPATALIAAAVPAAVGLLGGEPASPLLLAGMVIALVAVVLISIPDPGADQATAAPAPEPGSRPEPDPEPGNRLAAVATSRPAPRSDKWTWLLVVISGLGFASFYLGVDQAHAEGAGVWWTLLAVRIAALLVAVVATVLLVGAHRAQPLRATAPVVGLGALAALGDSGGNLFYILARAETTLSVAVVLVSLYPVSTALLARFVLGERLSRLRLAGVALAVAGVVTITAGAST
jgi:drug/metabolite transporter (DMT)-like permease